MSHKDAYKQIIIDTINGIDVADKLHDILQAKLQARLSEGGGTVLDQFPLPPAVFNKLIIIVDLDKRVDALCIAIGGQVNNTKFVREFMEQKDLQKWIEEKLMNPLGLSKEAFSKKGPSAFEKNIKKINSSLDAYYTE